MLALTLLPGRGGAFSAPACQVIVPDLVLRREFAVAGALPTMMARSDFAAA